MILLPLLCNDKVYNPFFIGLGQSIGSLWLDKPTFCSAFVTCCLVYAFKHQFLRLMQLIAFLLELHNKVKNQWIKTDQKPTGKDAIVEHRTVALVCERIARDSVYLPAAELEIKLDGQNIKWLSHS